MESCRLIVELVEEEDELMTGHEEEEEKEARVSRDRRRVEETNREGIYSKMSLFQ